jgi:hypothetical protein
MSSCIGKYADVIRGTNIIRRKKKGGEKEKRKSKRKIEVKGLNKCKKRKFNGKKSTREK